MCLAVPGKIVEVKKTDNSQTSLIGTVNFGGNEVEVSLAMVPDAQTGDYVLVHAGYALEKLDEEEAKRTWDYLEQAGIEIDKPL